MPVGRPKKTKFVIVANDDSMEPPELSIVQGPRE